MHTIDAPAKLMRTRSRKLLSCTGRSLAHTLIVDDIVAVLRQEGFSRDEACAFLEAGEVSRHAGLPILILMGKPILIMKYRSIEGSDNILDLIYWIDL